MKRINMEKVIADIKSKWQTGTRELQLEHEGIKLVISGDVKGANMMRVFDGDEDAEPLFVVNDLQLVMNCNLQTHREPSYAEHNQYVSDRVEMLIDKISTAEDKMTSTAATYVGAGVATSSDHNRQCNYYHIDSIIVDANDRIVVSGLIVYNFAVQVGFRSAFIDYEFFTITVNRSESGSITDIEMLTHDRADRLVLTVDGVAIKNAIINNQLTKM